MEDLFEIWDLLVTLSVWVCVQDSLQLKDGPAVGHPQRYLHERRRRQRE